MKYSKLTFYGLMVAVTTLLLACDNKEYASPTRKNITDAVFANGYIEQARQYTVSAKVDGILTSIPVSEGDTITQNTTVAVIHSEVQKNQITDAVEVYNNAVANAGTNSPILQQLQTQINQAKEQLTLDKINYERYKALRETNSVSQRDFEKAKLQFEASQNNLRALEESYKTKASDLQLNVKRSLVQVNTQKAILDDYKLSSSISGRVINVFKKQGELIKRGEAVAEIGSGTFIVKLFVAEDDIIKINKGQLVAVHLNTHPDAIFSAKISKIYPAFNPQEQSYVVEAQFDTLPSKLFSGVQLQANIETGKSTDVMVIPSQYLMTGNLVKLKNGDERKVVIGRKNNDWVEVLSGLSEEDVIVKPNA